VNKVSSSTQPAKAYRTGDRDLMREINEKLLLNLVRARGPISRADLAKHTRLSPATVSQIVQVLLDAKYIEEVGEGSSSGGRRPTLLKLDPNAGFVVGLKLLESSAAVVVTDLSAGVLHFDEAPLPAGASPEQTLRAANGIIRRSIADSGVNRGRVLGIGLCCHHRRSRHRDGDRGKRPALSWRGWRRG
jgi:hypothetical protein